MPVIFFSTKVSVSPSLYEPLHSVASRHELLNGSIVACASHLSMMRAQR